MSRKLPFQYKDTITGIPTACGDNMFFIKSYLHSGIFFTAMKASF